MEVITCQGSVVMAAVVGLLVGVVVGDHFGEKAALVVGSIAVVGVVVAAFL